jgi:biopolymer transport protein TolQ
MHGGIVFMGSISVQTSIIDSIFQASLVVQLTLLVLIGLSVLCWAVAYFKFQQIKKIKEANIPFLAKFEKVSSLDNLYENIDTFSDSSMARVFAAGYNEIQHPDNLERAIHRAIDNEISQLESKLNLLATTGSTGPFIGLFGTVWGIMGSFHKIGQTGSASLAVVAPGISEALVATAIGLAAAIPAVVMYNHFISQIKKEEVQLNDFGVDFLNMVKRHFGKE